MYIRDLDFKIKKKNLYEAVTNRMEGMILSNSLRQGERLPGGQELALKFGVNRNVVKESLKLLKERQLIVQRNGEGIFIAKPESGSTIEILSRILCLSDIGYVGAYEMHKLLEPYANRVVAEKKDDLGFEKLEQHLQGMIESKGIWNMRIDYDIQFHIRIAEATGSPLLICFIKSMVSFWKTILFGGIAEQQEGYQDGIEFYKQVIESLKKGDPDKVEVIIGAHVERSAEICWVKDTQ